MKRYLLLAFLLTGCIDESAVISDCDARGDLQPLCGWQSPEDMELLDDGRTVIVSEMEQGHGQVVGRLSLLHTEDGRREVMTHNRVESDEIWGDKQCTNPPGNYLAPHGIHLSRRSDGRQQLLVVNHGEREAIEFYEVVDTEGVYSLTWRGCAVAPAGTFMNDVVALPDGGFAATHMFDKPDAQVGTLSFTEAKALLGFNPGHLLRWSESGFTKVEGFSGDYPNGLQIGDDGNTLYINLWAGSKVVKFDLNQQQVLAEADLLHPDNSQWNEQGKLLVASHDFSLGDLRLCLRDGSMACPGQFRVMELDPETMKTRELLLHHGAPMGAGTVVQEVGQQWYIGSFLGDRMLRMPAR